MSIYACIANNRLFFPVISPDVPWARRRTEIIDKLQTSTAPVDFQPRAAFDGKKNLYTVKDLGPGKDVCTPVDDHT